jgi:hypothetical protein
MDQNGFFRWVWRLNALLLAVGGLFLLVMAIMAFFTRPWYGPTPEGHFAPVPKGAEKHSTYRIARLEISVGHEDIFQLGRWDGSPNEYGLQDIIVAPRSAVYTGPNTVNLLAVDDVSGASHWLFRGYDREIVRQETVTKRDEEPGPPTVAAPGTPAPYGNHSIALVIHTIDADTDKDGELTGKDRQSLYIYRPGMGFAVKLLDADLVLSTAQADDAHYLVVYERGRDAIAATYSLPDFKLVSQKRIPPVPD